jgi:hypothetical protein
MSAPAGLEMVPVSTIINLSLEAFLLPCHALWGCYYSSGYFWFAESRGQHLILSGISLLPDSSASKTILPSTFALLDPVANPK